MNRKVNHFLLLIRNSFKKFYFGFISSHSYLSFQQIETIEKVYNNPRQDVVLRYENQFSKMVGDGKAISYASARMGFYSLMKLLGIGPGDEVVLPAATCSVMANAIFRLGAIPIYADIDKNTFGSGLKGIKDVVSSNTKMIVAQHSFGIPCNIEPIVEFAKSRSIFLLEDCALTFDSSLNGISVGNFGDAAIFSTDRSKPLNTLLGGLVYSRDIDLVLRLEELDESLTLSDYKQKAIFDYFKFQLLHCNEENIARFSILYFLRSIFKKIFTPGSVTPFLDEDFSEASAHSYPYPAKLPPFLAQIGQFELDNWLEKKTKKKKSLGEFLKYSRTMKVYKFLPSAYFDSSLEITPHRIIWSQERGEKIRKKLSKLIDVSWIWFLRPIVSTDKPLSNFKYIESSCPISEDLGSGMINIPIVYNPESQKYLFDMVLKVIK